jgi:hypothetical protein
MRKFLASSTLGMLVFASTFADVTGTWKGVLDIGDAASRIKLGSSQKVSAPILTLILKKDGTFEQITDNSFRLAQGTNSSQTGNVKHTRTGTWTLKGNELTLNPSAQTVKAKQTVKVQKLVVGNDEKTLTMKTQAKVSAGSKQDADLKSVEITVVYKR